MKKRPRAKVREQVKPVTRAGQLRAYSEVFVLRGKIHVSAMSAQMLLDDVVTHAGNDPQAALDELTLARKELDVVEKLLRKIDAL